MSDYGNYFFESSPQGMTFRGQFTYDTEATTGWDFGPTHGDYTSPNNSLSFSIDGTGYSFQSGRMSMGVFNNYYYHSFDGFHLVAVNTWGESYAMDTNLPEAGPHMALDFGLNDFTQSVFNGTEIPSELLISDFDSPLLRLYASDYGFYDGVGRGFSEHNYALFGTLTSLSKMSAEVPEPSSIILLCLGLLAVSIRQRKAHSI
ncbi:PEP-CTERM sorting domain-containing protein [Teredinibacter sp. KSP-S5-2]|uniref:PEP-CTERM sorting domain-containing protein n=1 Tax=Teredinibacter sp. KSP-S5-2 TaxID=3034506 RepID=UPI00293450CB|nr:PEP-CTERM sorting domain-containing protein [Teredinibacter sp. KSP-S5-2]WNO07822.1 PEP-CTERM sorting domain-containing protein [Teredinibacter sp. KSP-S5-2]